MSLPVCIKVPEGEIWWVLYVDKRFINFVGRHNSKRSYEEEERENPKEQGYSSKSSP